MNKPITVIRAELINSLAESINGSGLPAFVVESILESMLLETKAVARQQYENDRLRYEAYLQSQTNNNDKEVE